MDQGTYEELADHLMEESRNSDRSTFREFVSDYESFAAWPAEWADSHQQDHLIATPDVGDLRPDAWASQDDLAPELVRLREQGDPPAGSPRADTFSLLPAPRRQPVPAGARAPVRAPIQVAPEAASQSAQADAGAAIPLWIRFLALLLPRDRRIEYVGDLAEWLPSAREEFHPLAIGFLLLWHVAS